MVLREKRVFLGSPKHKSCEEIRKGRSTRSQVYTIYPFHDRSLYLDVFCDFTVDEHGWMVRTPIINSIQISKGVLLKNNAQN